MYENEFDCEISPVSHKYKYVTRDFFYMAACK